MASDNRALHRPWLRKLLAILAGILMVLLLFIGWLLGTGSGARTALGAISSLSGGALQMQGIQGRLIGPLRLQQVTLERPNDSLTLTDIRLDWQPSALLQSRLHLTSLHVGRLILTGKIDTKPEPARLPESIALPFALQVDDVRVDGGEVNRGPVNLVRLGPFALSADFDGNRYQLWLREFAAGSTLQKGSVATRFNGQATLATTKPYALQGSFSSDSNAQIQDRKVGAIGRITLTGSLAEVATAIDFTVNQARIKGNAVLRPFSEQALGATQLRTQALDLSSFDSQLPQTALDIRLSATENGNGELYLSNSAAGLYNEQKLPLSSLSIAFRQDTGQFHFNRIAAGLGSAKQPAGEVTGNGRYANGALTLSLRTDALDLRRIDQRVRATRLAGNVDLRYAGGKQEFTIALREPLHRQQLVLEAHGVLADSRLAVDHAKLQAGNGRIDVSGHIALTGNQSFGAQGEVSRFHLQNLGNFAPLPNLDLNGRFSLRGTRQPELVADLSFDINDSRLAEQPLYGSGQAQLRGERLLVPKFLLQSGVNRLNIEGQLSQLTQGDSRLSFALSAPQLGQFGPRFGGALQANGVVRGSLKQARINAEWHANNIRLPGALQIDAMQGKADIALDRGREFIVDSAVADISARGMRYDADQLAMLSAQVRFAPKQTAPLAISIRAEGISASRLRAESFSAEANGTTAQHVINTALKENNQAWTLNASGGLDQFNIAPRWQGSIAALNASGRFNARLASPAPLLLSAQRVQLDRFLLDAEAGRIAVERFARDSEGIVTRGRLERLQLAQLLRMEPAPPIRTDLQFSGEWDMRIADAPTGSIKLRRDSGDVTVLGSTPVTLSLRALNADMNANGNRLALQLQADGRQLGRIDINAGTTIGGNAGRFSIAPEAPVTGSVRIDVPSLGWIAPLLSPSMIADGRLQSEISLGGSFGQPRFSGRIDGSALRLALGDVGLDLRQGTLQSEFQGNRLLIRQLTFQSGEGRLALSGPIDLGSSGIAAQLALQAERFTLLNRSDRRLVISGDSRVSWQRERAAVTGAFTVNSGFFDLGSADKPQLSRDVVIVGREKKKAAKMATAVDVTIGLGDGVVLKGRGLDALLAGQLRMVNAAGEALQARGTLSIARGTYTAYGRELAIEQGFLRFTGALDNPALDILAMRRGQEVEAGVSIRGTALAPRVRLVSEPSVPEAEKLSWLVLGRGLAAAGEGDMGTLQSAAGALLSEGAAAGVQSHIASAFGLDTFNIGTSQDSLQQRIVTLGKQVSSKLYVGYQQGLETAGSVLQLRYLLSPRLSVEAEAGSRSAVSLFYNIVFD